MATISSADFKAAMKGIKLVYELLTPITITLTPQQIATLRGANTIFADCGNVLNCEYRADTKMYIDKVIAGA